jgi:hypothetical protein
LARVARVSVPLAISFGAMLEKPTPSDRLIGNPPRGRSFNGDSDAVRRGARVVSRKESSSPSAFSFDDIDYLMNIRPSREMMYIPRPSGGARPHGARRDFEILPRVEGGGLSRAIFGVRSLPPNPGWWGEGEVRWSSTATARCPTLWARDEITSARGWGQGVFKGRFPGARER